MGLSATEVQARLTAGQSPRYKKLDRFQRYVDGTQYDGRPHFLDSTSEAPLLERAPCIVYPILGASIHSHVALCIGEHRFPGILSSSSEDDSKFDPKFGLNPKDSETLDRSTQKLVEQTRLKSACEQILAQAMGTSTAVVVVGVVNGKFQLTQIDAKCCTPAFKPGSTTELASLEASWRYVEDQWDATAGEWTKVVKVYRRVIDAQNDTTFVPVEVKHPQDFPKPSVPDPDKTVAHGFGFVPVVWYPFMRQAGSGDIDGNAVGKGLCDQIDALNFALSMRHRAALYASDPERWETGVDPDDQPNAMGRAAMPKKGDDGWGNINAKSGRASRRKRGVTQVATYSSPDTKVGLLTLPGDALKANDEHVRDVRSKICEALAVTWIDPMALRGTADISGKALAVIYANQIARCDQIREDFAQGCLLPIVNLLFRIMLATGDGLYLAGADKANAILKRFYATDTNAVTRWIEPSLTLKWGDYFEASDVDEATRVTMALNAYDKGAITIATRTEHIKDIFRIQNVDQYVDQLQKESMQKQADAIASAQAMAKAIPPAATDGAKPAQSPKTNGAQPNAAMPPKSPAKKAPLS